MTGRARAAAGLRLVAALAALVAGLLVLWRAGSAFPPVPHDPEGLRTVAEAEPLAVAVGVLRLVALALGTGLLAVSGLGILARCCGAARVAAHSDRWTPAGLRRLLDGALGVGLAASIGLSSVPASADPGGETSTTLRRLPDQAPSTTISRLPDAAPAPASERSPPTLRRLPDRAAEVPAPAAPAAVVNAAPPAAPPPASGEVVVQPGDSFWRLAERHEAERLGRRPTEAEVGACWQQLVASNRGRLPVPGDPDLLFPGQVLIVPCP